jgi:hypothetical protein
MDYPQALSASAVLRQAPADLQLYQEYRTLQVVVRRKYGFYFWRETGPAPIRDGRKLLTTGQLCAKAKGQDWQSDTWESEGQV